METTVKTGRLPDFLLVGAAKAGTTSLAAWLRAHPQIFVTGQRVLHEKELHFFDRHWDEGVDWYRAKFADAPPGAIAGEATSAYGVHEVYVERMASVVPDARLIVLVRRPAERAWSHYRHIVASGAETRSFAEVVAAELAADPASWQASGGMLARGRYTDQLRRLTAHYARERIHVGLFDDLAARPDDLYASVCRFLGVDDRIRPKEVGRAFDAYAIDPQIATSDGTWAGKLRRLLPGSADRGAPQGRRVTGPMPDDVRRTLVDYFRPYNEELGRWIGVDLSHWNT